VTTHEERVRQSFSRQAFMSTLGAELTSVVQEFKAVWRFACHFRRILRNRTTTCTRVRSLRCWILLAVMPP
jgi:hypothetical protein